MRTSRRRGPEARLLGSVALLIIALMASGVGPPRSAGVAPLPSLPIPSLPLPSLPIPSLPLPSLPIPSVPISSLPLPSLPIPSLPLTLESVSPNSASSQPSPSASGAEADASAAGNAGLRGESPPGRAQPLATGGSGGQFGLIGLPQLVVAGSAAFLIVLLGLYVIAGAGWLAVVRRQLGGMGLRVSAWREERLRGRHPGA